MSNINKTIKTIFIGTPDFSVPTMQALIKDKRFDIAAVITQPDKKTGRKQILTPPPIKTEAKKYKIPIFQPSQITNYQLLITNIDLIIVIAYAQILPKHILNLPKYGCINIHASLLPKYRGASCVQAAILNGDPESGITIMKMDAGLDTGPIIWREKIKIHAGDTGGSLHNKLSQLSANIAPQILNNYIIKKIKLAPQDNARASYAPILKKSDGHIGWNKKALEIERFIRAMQPWPGAYNKIKNKLIIKIIQTANNPLKINKHKPGKIFLFDNQLVAQCGQDALIIKQVQLAGKKAMSTDEFIRGHKNFIGEILR